LPRTSSEESPISKELERDLSEFVDSELAVEKLEEELKASKKRNTALRIKIHDALQAANIRSINRDDLGRFVPTARLYTNLAKPEVGEGGEVENEDARAMLEAWSKNELDAAGHPLFDELFYFAIKSMRLRALVKERLEEGMDPPPGVEYGYQPNISWTRPDRMRGK
jgi:hypothetical protein